jgi:hypothetical protein
MGSLWTSDYRYNAGGPYGAAADQYKAQQQATYNQQQGLAEALKQQMMGAGPSPAQEMLKQATNRGIKQSSAMVASQKGINPALAQRLAAENAAASSQEAAGQGAVLRAQERIAAMGGLAGVLGQMGTQSLQGQGQYLGANANENQTNAGIAQANTAATAGVVGSLLNSAGAAGQGGMRGKAEGGKIDGLANVPGDSYANDTVPAMLSPGEIVIPRSKAQDPEKAKAFVDQLLKGHEEGQPDDEVGYHHVLKAHRELQEKVKKLEEKLKKKK